MNNPKQHMAKCLYDCLVNEAKNGSAAEVHRINQALTLLNYCIEEGSCQKCEYCVLERIKKDIIKTALT